MSVENERADAGLDSRNYLSQPNSQARSGIQLKLNRFPCLAERDDYANKYTQELRASESKMKSVLTDLIRLLMSAFS